ncbi:MAG: polyprenyl synthetase family protein [Parcubacteria group bacterium]
MDAKTELQKYKKILDLKLKEYFAVKIGEAKKISPLAVQAVRNIEEMTLAGGKRVRAAFMYWGYKAAGGRENAKMIEVSMSIELSHIFLLIHDDIIDRDEFRHGVSAVHKKYEGIARKFYRRVEPVHFGESMGMIVGDMAAAFGNEIIFNSKFSPKDIMRTLDKLQKIVSMTVVGEMSDIVLEAKGKATEKDVLEVHEQKTAKYTVEGPLHLGALLAGTDKKVLDALSAYAVPVGIAFQIQDDILGVFGSEEKLGKPVCSDLREGKQTLLIVKALEKANNEQEKKLKAMIGNRDIKEEDVEEFRKIIRETGSLRYSQNMACDLIEKGKTEVLNSDISSKSKNFLVGVADYMVNREV